MLQLRSFAHRLVAHNHHDRALRRADAADQPSQSLHRIASIPPRTRQPRTVLEKCAQASNLPSWTSNLENSCPLRPLAIPVVEDHWACTWRHRRFLASDRPVRFLPPGDPIKFHSAVSEGSGLSHYPPPPPFFTSAAHERVSPLSYLLLLCPLHVAASMALCAHQPVSGFQASV